MRRNVVTQLLGCYSRMPPGSRIKPQLSQLTRWRYKHTGNAVKKVLDRDPRPLDEAYQDGYEETEDGTVRRKKPVPWDDTYVSPDSICFI